MVIDHWYEQLIIDLSRAQREAIALPVDTGETYDKDGKIVQDHATYRSDTSGTGIRNRH